MYKTVRTIKDFAIDEIAESGQCFRITQSTSGSWQIIALGRVLNIKQTGQEQYELSCTEEEFDSVWREYFDLDTDYAVYREAALPDDEYLRKAFSLGSGIRILRQEPWEMLISFIISQRKSVPAIRTSVERLSERFGERIADTPILHYAFPTPEELAKAPTEELAACGLGYRVDYVREAARLASCGALDLYALNRLDTDELIAALMQLKGVGIKVASCVALFGYHRLDTVPVDVWMKRVIDTVYNGTMPEEYRQYAGVLQQYMFNYARLNKVGV